MNALNSVTIEHDRTTLEFPRASWGLKEERNAFTNIEYTNAGIITGPLQLDNFYRTLEAVSGSELFRSAPVLTISMREHELLMERGLVEYDRLWKELAGM